MLTRMEGQFTKLILFATNLQMLVGQKVESMAPSCLDPLHTFFLVFVLLNCQKLNLSLFRAKSVLLYLHVERSEIVQALIAKLRDTEYCH